jgi:hypothetical protein
MNRIAIALTAALLGTSAANAQYGTPPGPPRGYDAGAFWHGAPDSPYQRIQFLQDRVNRGIADGSLDRREATRVNRELGGVRQWIHRMHWEDEGRLTPEQRGRVQARLDQISGQIRWLRHNGW